MILPKLHITWERWRWNKEHQLFVSTLGNFKNKDKQPMKLYTSGSGYLAVKSRSTKKLVLAHRLVMQTWKPIPNADEMTVDHLDHNKRNNCLKNLEWVTKEENWARAEADQGNKKPTKIKFIATNYTLEHFYLCVNGLYLIEPQDVLNYVRTQYSDAGSFGIEAIIKIYSTLINAYNNNNPEYVKNGFIKKKFNCEFSIVKKGE